MAEINEPARASVPVHVARHKEANMTLHAHGTFTVTVLPLSPAPAEGLNRYSINKQIGTGISPCSIWRQWTQTHRR
jgi:hypothetical protein